MAFYSLAPSKTNVFETLLCQIPSLWSIFGHRDAEPESNRRKVKTQKRFEQNLLKFVRGIFEGC